MTEATKREKKELLGNKFNHAGKRSGPWTLKHAGEEYRRGHTQFKRCPCPCAGRVKAVKMPTLAKWIYVFYAILTKTWVTIISETGKKWIRFIRSSLSLREQRQRYHRPDFRAPGAGVRAHVERNGTEINPCVCGQLIFFLQKHLDTQQRKDNLSEK